MDKRMTEVEKKIIESSGFVGFVTEPCHNKFSEELNLAIKHKKPIIIFAQDGIFIPAYIIDASQEIHRINFDDDKNQEKCKSITEAWLTKIGINDEKNSITLKELGSNPNDRR